MPYPSLPGHRPPEELKPPAALRQPKAQPKPASRPAPQSRPATPRSANTAKPNKSGNPTSTSAPQATKPSHSARIHSWDHSKGYGFLRHGKKRLFLHRRDFAEHHKKPMPGDLIHFEEGQDAQGRPCAVQAYHHNDGGRLRAVHFIQLTVLILLPALALFKLATATGIHLAAPYAVALILSLITYLRYAKDKQSARAKAWRISESQLHFLSLIGGWPGAFLAQRKLRHKCSKPDFLAIFWLTLLTHQYLALDYLRHWQLTRSILARITEVS
ncbi:DUF1294 domain-containing protein [Verrucomicrobiaceae bacterium 5K15]|uniref:DUF1294 domain-containing protein n=1 Tax=Oceaniferula flava TaxID=2800421 RepID=A0AAE2SD54_9BACT|nr:DUF1294 domain-containing protein [Oceaniferula flavus]MBK1856036.1 DUF1294 domain-containing protein [Oceaniferula flavus]MBM1137343.1 DUF1294 domain-containing protein [Oceaniferula flavus]